MPKGTLAVSKEVKEQIIKRIKEDGQPVAKVASEHGLQPRTIYQWISRHVTGTPSLLELARLKRENQNLKELIGQITPEMSVEKKKTDDR